MSYKEMAPRKVHLHSEQFDGHLHAACCRILFDPPGPHPMILGEDEFALVPREKRCHYCSVINFPHGEYHG